MKQYQVGVVIAIYNSTIEKIKRTLLSVINQEGVTIQIVLADDGSQLNLEESVTHFLSKQKVSDYLYIRNDANSGTVINILNGVMVCDCEYVKTLGQGDVLYDRNTLANMYFFAKNNNLASLAGDYKCFRIIDNTAQLEARVKMPQDPRLLIRRSNIDKFILNGNTVNGSTILYERDFFELYLTKLKGKVKYSEDLIFRLYVLDGLNIDYYTSPVLYYEVGDGVSSSGDKIWKKTLQEDQIGYYEIATENLNRLNKKPGILHNTCFLIS